MKIAVVGPSPIPYTIGGAENLMWGLCDAINQLTPHQAELIKVPTREHDFWGLIESYYHFYQMDLSHFDQIITMKYPSWMVQHPNNICYMMHTLRGFYDTWHLMNIPDDVRRGPQKINQLLDYMETWKEPENLEEFFSLVFTMREDREIPAHYFAFPGSLIRLLVRYMDHFALTRPGVQKYCAISNTVKERKDYFPEGSHVETIYPPTVLKNCTSGNYDYVFMISRLDAPKRIDMLIKAMKYVKSDVKLLIAGTGPEKERLEKLAKGDHRIQFLGFVRDEEVEQYYANSLVVPYFPYDEDYGYITIEAMLHKKPVITTVDAGGPTEFVEDGESGFITAFDAKKIAEKIDFYAKNREEAKRHGENGYKTVSAITWSSVVEQLLKSGVPKMNKTRQKAVVTTTFSIYPPQGGGQARVYYLYKNLAKYYDVEIVAFDRPDKRKIRHTIAPGLIENCVPKTEKHQQNEYKIESKVNIPVTDIAMISLSGQTPAYGEELKQAMKDSDMVIVCHPYLYPEVKKYLGDQKLIYEAQDVEYCIKKEMLPDNALTRDLLKQIYDVEKECCEKSEIIMTCSEKDKETLAELYHISKEKIVVVPNGVDCSQTYYTPVQQRLENKKSMGLANEKLGLFMGSWHQPNLEACEEIFKIAEKCPDTKFLLMGSQCMYFEKKKYPSNVGLLGLVDEDAKNRIFSAVDFALNPMMSGSGTNLKMFDYMSAGIPVISTEFGTRGIDNKDVMIIREVDQMADAVNEFSLEEQETVVSQARTYTEETFDWSVIVEHLVNEM